MSTEVKTQLGTEKYLMNISAGKNQIIADEPIAKGGQEKGFNPYELLASSLSACTAATVKIFADRREWALDEVEVKVVFEDKTAEGHALFKKYITLHGNLDEDQKATLMKAAHACPVQKILTSEIAVEAELV
ncbi:OsmC family protein [Riemerella columbina]|uniref:OsmC family protein n=1 Tax=Riemerella columbina TaxID=103810 RepID=UPI00266F8E90|nr:OsmC family protein [Riemerella columbina]WKS96003.1 OsmC family protein [Riemerella columbina]